MAEEDARDDVSGPFKVVVVGLGMAYGAALSVGFVQYAIHFDFGHQQNYWLGAGFVLATAQCLILLDCDWLRHVNNTLFGLWVALMFWWPAMPMRFEGPLFSTAAGFWVAGWHRERLLRAEPGLSWADVRVPLALGGWAATAVAGVLTAGVAYAALWLLIAKAVQTPDARPGVALTLAVIGLLGIAAWWAAKAVRARRKGRAALANGSPPPSEEGGQAGAAR